MVDQRQSDLTGFQADRHNHCENVGQLLDHKQAVGGWLAISVDCYWSVRLRFIPVLTRTDIGAQ